MIYRHIFVPFWSRAHSFDLFWLRAHSSDIIFILRAPKPSGSVRGDFQAAKNWWSLAIVILFHSTTFWWCCEPVLDPLHFVLFCRRVLMGRGVCVTWLCHWFLAQDVTFKILKVSLKQLLRWYRKHCLCQYIPPNTIKLYWIFVYSLPQCPSWLFNTNTFLEV